LWWSISTFKPQRRIWICLLKPNIIPFLCHWRFLGCEFVNNQNLVPSWPILLELRFSKASNTLQLTQIASQSSSIPDNSIYQISRWRCFYQAHWSWPRDSWRRSSNYTRWTSQTPETSPTDEFWSSWNWERKRWIAGNRWAGFEVQCKHMGSRLLRQTLCWHQCGLLTRLIVSIYSFADQSQVGVMSELLLAVLNTNVCSSFTLHDSTDTHINVASRFPSLPRTIRYWKDHHQSTCKPLRIHRPTFRWNLNARRKCFKHNLHYNRTQQSFPRN